MLHAMKAETMSSTAKTRRYSSPLRERQAEQTRELILQALTEQLAEDGLNDFNIPRVARRAGVSVRTVYRYFPTREALLDGLQIWVDEGILDTPRPKTAEELISIPPAQFRQFDEHVPLVLAQIASPAGLEVQARGRRKRLEAYRAALNEVTSNLSEEEARTALAVVSRLFRSTTWKDFREEFAMSGEEAGRAVSWALSTLIEDLKRRNEQAGRSDAPAFEDVRQNPE